MITKKRDIKSMDVGLALVLLLLLAYNFSGNSILVSAAMVLLLFCMVAPGIFRPFARIWFGLSEYMAIVMSHLLLTLVFTFMVIPIGCARRFMGKDEPTSGLDPFARRQLMALLREFRHTKIFTSHDLDMVLELCSRTIVLHDGVMVADGPTSEIFRNDALLAACRLEKPFSMQGCPISNSRLEKALTTE